jgi:shikimate kinase
LERVELELVSRRERVVAALGGGAILDARNRELIAATGTAIWLDASMDTLFPRLAGDASRPLAACRMEMEGLLESRRPFYEQATLRIRADGLAIEEIAREILCHVDPQAAGQI